MTTDMLTSLAVPGGFSTLGGFLVGYAGKKVIKIGAVIAGIGVAGLGALDYSGMMTIHWNKVQQAAVNASKWAAQQGTAVEHHLTQSFGSSEAMAVGGGFLFGLMLGVKTG